MNPPSTDPVKKVESSGKSLALKKKKKRHTNLPVEMNGGTSETKLNPSHDNYQVKGHALAENLDLGPSPSQNEEKTFESESRLLTYRTSSTTDETEKVEYYLLSDPIWTNKWPPVCTTNRYNDYYDLSDPVWSNKELATTKPTGNLTWNKKWPATNDPTGTLIWSNNRTSGTSGSSDMSYELSGSDWTEPRPSTSSAIRNETFRPKNNGKEKKEGIRNSWNIANFRPESNTEVKNTRAGTAPPLPLNNLEQSTHSVNIETKKKKKLQNTNYGESSYKFSAEVGAQETPTFPQPNHDLNNNDSYNWNVGQATGYVESTNFYWNSEETLCTDPSQNDGFVASPNPYWTSEEFWINAAARDNEFYPMNGNEYQPGEAPTPPKDESVQKRGPDLKNSPKNGNSYGEMGDQASLALAASRRYNENYSGKVYTVEAVDIHTPAPNGPNENYGRKQWNGNDKKKVQSNGRNQNQNRASPKRDGPLLAEDLLSILFTSPCRKRQ